MRILVVGGTRFVGRHIVEAALGQGHQVTVFHRGSSGRELFPAAEHLLGDRDGDLSALASGRWDATVDTCAYLPRQVRGLAAALDGRGGHHTFISTMSVYADPTPRDFTEDAPLTELADPTVEEVTGETYGGLKVQCERAAEQAYDDLLVIRPTYVVGPHDHTGRFPYWVRRIAAGGEVLAPAPPDSPLQVIDARDQGSWVAGLIGRRAHGTFNAVSPPPPFTFADVLETIAGTVAPAGTTLAWVDEEFLLEQGEDWRSIPLWGAGEPPQSADPAAAYGSGLSPRPLHQTVREVLEWLQAEAPDLPADVGLTPAREAELLAAWRGR